MVLSLARFDFGTVAHLFVQRVARWARRAGAALARIFPITEAAPWPFRVRLANPLGGVATLANDARLGLGGGLLLDEHGPNMRARWTKEKGGPLRRVRPIKRPQRGNRMGLLAADRGVRNTVSSETVDAPG